MPERKHQHKRVAGVEEKEPLPQKLSRKNKHIAEGKGKEERIAKKISQKHKRAAEGENDEEELLRKKASSSINKSLQ